MREPVCPVGRRHPSSNPPTFGCDGCPAETHICFKDTRTSNLPTCCPKPCANIDDVFIDGACFRHVMHGEPCTHDLNCKSAGALYDYGEHMKCIGTTPELQVCGCSDGLFHLHGKCQGTVSQSWKCGLCDMLVTSSFHVRQTPRSIFTQTIFPIVVSLKRTYSCTSGSLLVVYHTTLK